MIEFIFVVTSLSDFLSELELLRMTDFVADLFATDLIPVKVPVGSDGFSVVYAISPVACIFVLAFACVLVRKIVQAVRS